MKRPAPTPTSVLYGNVAGRSVLEWRIDFPGLGEFRPVGFFLPSRLVRGKKAAVKLAQAAWRDFFGVV